MSEIQRWKVTEPYLHLHCGLGEAPYYEESTNTLRFVDIVKSKFHTVNVKEGPSSHKIIHVEHPITTTAHIEGTDEDLIVGAKYGYAYYNRTSNELKYTKKVWDANDGPGKAERMRTNDGAIDALGRYWVGTMNDPLVTAPQNEGVLFRLDPNMSLHRMIENAAIPNGIGWSLDNTKMYFIDSPSKNIFVYDFNLQSGAISNRQVFWHYPDNEEGVPDGFAMDVEGALWVAICGGGKVVRVNMAGEVVGCVALPTRMISCPAFARGGEMYVTSAEEEEPEKYPDSVAYGGSVFRVDVEVEGKRMHRFRREG